MADSSPGSEPLLLENRDPVSGYSAVFDDDGKTAYAYLRKDGKIVGDVWLYNRGAPPDEPEWNDRTNMPFANPKEFASDESFTPVSDASELRFQWIQSEDSPTLRIFVRGEPFAVLRAGSKPGWSKLAIDNGPLALKLEEGWSQ